jgi:Fe-Mn family superoxide dismutase
MEIHYSKHHAGYVKNLNDAIKGTDLEKSNDLSAILKNISKYSPAIRNNAGGHYNHTFFWKILKPQKKNAPSEKMTKVIDSTFGSLDKFKAQFNKEGTARFGSGWVWLIVNPDKKLVIMSSPNQDNPLMDDSPIKGVPVLGVDVWEHAYYLKYQNKRGDYLQAIWNVINWKEIEALYEKAMAP